MAMRFMPQIFSWKSSSETKLDIRKLFELDFKRQIMHERDLKVQYHDS
jgi:hypothetical protein